MALWDKRHAVADQFAWRLHEDSPPYNVRPSEDHDQRLFFHETLDVHRAGLDLVRWMVALPGATALPTRSHRQIDEGVTSILRNIAEGNGRYSEVDHRHFLDLAAAAAVKVAAGLDLATRKASWDRTACEPGKALFERIMARCQGCERRVQGAGDSHSSRHGER